MHEASRHRPSTLEIISKCRLTEAVDQRMLVRPCLQRAREAYGGYTMSNGRLAGLRRLQHTRAVGRPPVGDLSIRTTPEV